MVVFVCNLSTGKPRQEDGLKFALGDLVSNTESSSSFLEPYEWYPSMEVLKWRRNEIFSFIVF